MENKAPLRKSNILVQQIGGELLLYNTEFDTVHALNPSAKQVWELCDGNHTVLDIVKWLKISYTVSNHQDLQQDVYTILETFSEQGLLIWDAKIYA